MKKFVTILLSICMCLSMGVAMTACNQKHTHKLTKVEAVAATCEDTGNSEYYTCSCGKYFSDASGKTEIAKNSWIISANGHYYNTKTYSVENDVAYLIKTCNCGDSEKTEIENAIVATPQTAQSVLNGEKGSLDNKIVVFAKGTYEQTLYLGVPTKFEGSNTTYVGIQDSQSGLVEFKTIEEIKNMTWGTRLYSRSMKNVKFVSEESVVLAGIEMTSGHVYGEGYDYVIDKEYSSGSIYYVSHDVEGLVFEGLSFKNKVDLESSQSGIKSDYGDQQQLLAPTSIKNVMFENCKFDLGGTESSVGPAIRIYSEDQENVITIENVTICNTEIKNAYQGIYTHHVKDITIANCTIESTGHNAIAIQDHGSGLHNHGTVTISNNKFNNINDRIIRFNAFVGTAITIKNNVATNSGDDDKEVIKATSLTAAPNSEIVFDISNNQWGDGAIVHNEQLKDAQ